MTTTTPRKRRPVRAAPEPSEGRKVLLEAIQARLREALLNDERTQPRDLSALAARLLAVSDSLAELEQAEEREAAEGGDDAARVKRRRRYEEETQ